MKASAIGKLVNMSANKLEFGFKTEMSNSRRICFQCSDNLLPNSIDMLWQQKIISCVDNYHITLIDISVRNVSKAIFCLLQIDYSAHAVIMAGPYATQVPQCDDFITHLTPI